MIQNKKIKSSNFALDSQMRRLYFQPKQRQLNLLLSICRCLNIHILQYFQNHFPVNSLFIHVVWILIIHTSWIHCTIIIMFPNQDKIVNICWIPSHINIYGNNEADKAAKSAFEFELKIPSTDLKYFIKLYINSLWQIFGNFCDISKLHSIQNKKRTYQIYKAATRILSPPPTTHIKLFSQTNEG